MPTSNDLIALKTSFMYLIINKVKISIYCYGLRVKQTSQLVTFKHATHHFSFLKMPTQDRHRRYQ